MENSICSVVIKVSSYRQKIYNRILKMLKIPMKDRRVHVINLPAKTEYIKPKKNAFHYVFYINGYRISGYIDRGKFILN